MKLPVLAADGGDQPWYADGLNFTCTQCGNCCTGGEGFVWINDAELAGLAEHLKLSIEETDRRYCRPLHGRRSLKEIRNERGEYDCVFLTPLPGEGVQGHGPRKWGCSIYPVRPLQCRTWPFWDGTLASEFMWEVAGQRCEGINQGRHYTAEQIERLRDATTWPADAPSSEE